MKAMNTKLIGILFLASLCVSCATTGGTHTDVNTERGFNGYWTDTDVDHVATSLASNCTADSSVQKFYEVYGRKPVLVVGVFTNESSEKIETDILQRAFETNLQQNTSVDFIAKTDDKGAIVPFATEAEALVFAEDSGADLMLCGTVNTLLSVTKGRNVRRYDVHAKLVSVSDARELWSGEDNSIAKVIRRVVSAI